MDESQERLTPNPVLNTWLPWAIVFTALIYYLPQMTFYMSWPYHVERFLLDFGQIFLGATVVAVAVVLAFSGHEDRMRVDRVFAGLFALEAVPIVVGFAFTLPLMFRFDVNTTANPLQTFAILSRTMAAVALVVMLYHMRPNRAFAITFLIFLICSLMPYVYLATQSFPIMYEQPNGTLLTIEEALAAGIITPEEAAEAPAQGQTQTVTKQYRHPTPVAYILYGLIALYLFWIRPKWIAAEQAVDE